VVLAGSAPRLTYEVVLNGTGNGSGTNLETACVDAYYAEQQEWNMLRTWLGRNGIDGNGRGFQARVGLNDTNAFWNGRFGSFGHNSANNLQATSIDVVAHEFGHAIFQFTPGGSGAGNETGGLNEAGPGRSGVIKAPAKALPIPETAARRPTPRGGFPPFDGSGRCRFAARVRAG
jgi:Zn-dependent metalloprotease